MLNDFKKLKKPLIFSGMCLIAMLISGSSIKAASFFERLKGKIILEVEENGEAWYVNPNKQAGKLLFYLGRPTDAFLVMESQGIGITDNDLSKFSIGLIDFDDSQFNSQDTRCSWRGICAAESISGGYYYNGSNDDCFYIPAGSKGCDDPPFNTLSECLNTCKKAGGDDKDGDGLPNMLEHAINTDPNNQDTDGDGYNDKEEILNDYNPNGAGKLNIDNYFSNLHKGKIFLQIENKGEAWYINPDDGKKYFLGKPTDAFNIMRKLGLGIGKDDMAAFKKELNLKGQKEKNWKTYTSDFGFQIDFPEMINGKEFIISDFKRIEYNKVHHYIMNLGQMYITIYGTGNYDFIHVKQSECYDANDEESCSERNEISCGSGKCTEIPNINKNLANVDAVLYSKKINRCYADLSGETICPESEYEDNILITKKADFYYKIKQPIFSPTSLTKEEKEAYEVMIKSFKFVY